MNCALIVAPETALLAANVRKSSASGSMSDTSISEPIARTSQMTRSLIGSLGCRSRRSGQLHPDTADGVQVLGPLRALAELAPEPGDELVNGLVGAAVRHPPHVREQFALGHHLPCPHGQVVQQVELASGQVERAAFQRRLVRLNVQPE